MRVRANNASGGGGHEPQTKVVQIQAGTGYQTITFDFEPKAIVMWTDNDYAGYYTSDPSAPYDVYLTASRVKYDLPRSSSSGYYCEIKNVTGNTVEIWNYVAYTLTLVAYG